jgi:hypothetical protein
METNIALPASPTWNAARETLPTVRALDRNQAPGRQGGPSPRKGIES